MRLIDADALMKHAMRDKLDSRELIAHMIDSAPTIEPKHGEWTETFDGTMCSNCHKFPYDDGEYHIANWYSDFCPNCGADMRKEGE